MGKILIITGVILILVGGVLLLVETFGIGKIPGDIVIKSGNIKIYIPLGTAILISVLGTLLLNLLLFLWRKF